jgi:formaldehyde-activating enzyme involved in methanogenesis
LNNLFGKVQDMNVSSVTSPAPQPPPAVLRQQQQQQQQTQAAQSTGQQQQAVAQAVSAVQGTPPSGVGSVVDITV